MTKRIKGEIVIILGGWGGGGGGRDDRRGNFQLPILFSYGHLLLLGNSLLLQSLSTWYVIKLQKLVYHNHRCTPKEEQLPTVNTKLRGKGGGGSPDNL